MSSALDRVSVARQMAYVEKVIKDGLREFNGQPNDLVTKANMANRINEMYASMGLSEHFSASVLPSIMERIEQHITKTLPPETDGTVQMGDGDGPDVIEETKIIERDVNPNEVQVSIQVKTPAVHSITINLQQ